MKKTSLFEKHVELNAKMVDFGGFNMPIEYSGISDEHINVRNNVGIFDVSHMGEFLIYGKKSESFLQSVLSNDISILQRWSCMNLLLVDQVLILQVSRIYI